MHVLVIGGTGFVGRHLIARLSAAGHSVLVPSRYYAHGRDLQILPTVTLLETNIYDDNALDRLVQNCDIVINLVGILQGNRGRPYGSDFARVHVMLPERIAQSCVRYAIKQFIHVSALGAESTGPSMYLRSKGDGERAIQKVLADTPIWTILRPSVIFGPDDQFTNLFARLARSLPVLPLAGANVRMQPIYVGDVVTAIQSILGHPLARANTYPLVGPQVYTLAELARLCSVWAGHPRYVLRLPNVLGRLQAMLLEYMPGKTLMSRDNLDSMKVESIWPHPLADELGVTLTTLEAVAPGYLIR